MERLVYLPRNGYKTVAGRSLPEAYVKVLEKIKNDPKFIALMQREGHVRVTVALVLRIAVKRLAEDMGYRIGEVPGKEGK